MPPACEALNPLLVLPSTPQACCLEQQWEGTGLAKLTLTNHGPHPRAALTVWSPWRHGNLRPLVNGNSTRLQQWGRA